MRRKAPHLLLLAAAPLLTHAACTLPKVSFDAVDKLDPRSYLWRHVWMSDYTSAEQQAAKVGKPILIFFKDAKPWAPDPNQDMLKSSPVADRIDDFVRCELQRSYEPDRRYVRQFGVERAPALILVHRDGTFHAIAGELNRERVTTFLADAKPPGATPNSNPYLSRPMEYAWLSSVDEAKDEAKKTDRPVFVVLDRPWSRNSERLGPMIQRQEVHSRVREMVHCRPSALWKFGEDGGEFSVENLPALVVVQPDGTFRALEMPTSYQAIVRFLDETESSAFGPPEARTNQRRHAT